jgi:hypothetical protein
MFGQGVPLGELDFWAGVVVVVDGELDDAVVGVLDCVPAALVVAVLCVVGEAAALAMPAAVPAVASAPASIVAPSSLEMVIGSNLLGSIGGLCRASCATSLSGSAGMRRGCVRPLVGCCPAAIRTYVRALE